MVELSLTGLILAGGKSRRMGRDKALLLYHNRTFLECCQKLLQDIGCSEIYVSSNTLANSIPDNYVDIGPVAGIEAVLCHLNNQNYQGLVIVLPVDMVNMTTRSLQSLIQAIGHYDLVAYYNNPLPMVMRCNSLNADRVSAMAQQASCQGGMSIKSMSHSLNSITIPILETEDLLNINTPSDLEQFIHE